MAFFDFIENFFFISLGITFGLILLLVYHFKQRIAMMEKKGDTMYELMTNVVKELQIMKKLNSYYESIFQGSLCSDDSPLLEKEEKESSGDIHTAVDHARKNNTHVSSSNTSESIQIVLNETNNVLDASKSIIHMNNEVLKKIVVSDDSDDSSDSDSDIDSDNESDSDMEGDIESGSDDSSTNSYGDAIEFENTGLFPHIYETSTIPEIDAEDLTNHIHIESSNLEETSQNYMDISSSLDISNIESVQEYLDKSSDNREKMGTPPEHTLDNDETRNVVYRDSNSSTQTQEVYEMVELQELEEFHVDISEQNNAIVSNIEEPRPSNEVPSNEVPSNEVPSNEVPSNEVPSNEVSSNEVPSNEVPSNEVPSPSESENVVEEDVSSKVEKKPTREIYRKMNITQLRSIATVSGITVDTSKMKKNELIQLLENLEE